MFIDYRNLGNRFVVQDIDELPEMAVICTHGSTRPSDALTGQRQLFVVLQENSDGVRIISSITHCIPNSTAARLYRFSHKVWYLSSFTNPLSTQKLILWHVWQKRRHFSYFMFALFFESNERILAYICHGSLIFQDCVQLIKLHILFEIERIRYCGHECTG